MPKRVKNVLQSGPYVFGSEINCCCFLEVFERLKMLWEIVYMVTRVEVQRHFIFSTGWASGILIRCFRSITRCWNYQKKRDLFACALPIMQKFNEIGAFMSRKCFYVGFSRCPIDLMEDSRCPIIFMTKVRLQCLSCSVEFEVGLNGAMDANVGDERCNSCLWEMMSRGDMIYSLSKFGPMVNLFI